ncbi:MAG: hypothetical protein AB3K77_04865 [Methanosarcinaceae archaeon]|uniref:hypothetical protein n=1 Tax=unclassified Methanosarcina TaxID=2644672 RepID=UPI00064E8C14|nr:hypothetical protein [Methanosarcina sp. MTP4]
MREQKIRDHRTGKWFGLLVLVVGVLYLLSDLAKTFEAGISGWTTFFLLAGLWLISRRPEKLLEQ